LLEVRPQGVLGRHVAITSCDSGPLFLNDEAKQLAWGAEVVSRTALKRKMLSFHAISMMSGMFFVNHDHTESQRSLLFDNLNSGLFLRHHFQVYEQ